MSASPEACRVARQWIEKAEGDLLTAEHTLSLGTECPTDTVCYHAQQCVEKYIKALLTLEGIDFPKTHDIAELVALLPDLGATGLTAEQQERLTRFATVTRYPGDYPPITLAETRTAVEIAKSARARLRGCLPPVLKER